ncbi:hypothetical protein C8Q80DRAFT_1105569 [Daedaleopsis nitida]|nr:hypothetical protein C8Q80DRAFT_1105569 [Daedaleopsis nitida]
MLVLHPSSRCDVCLDGYHGFKEPLAIPCGHIFCHWCLQSLPKPQCPLCRIDFGAQDVRRLHVDKTALPPSTPAFTSADLELLASHARKLQSAITRVVFEGASVNEFRELLSEVNAWLSMQDAAQVRIPSDPPLPHPSMAVMTNASIVWRSSCGAYSLVSLSRPQGKAHGREAARCGRRANLLRPQGAARRRARELPIAVGG